MKNLTLFLIAAVLLLDGEGALAKLENSSYQCLVMGAQKGREYKILPHAVGMEFQVPLRVVEFPEAVFNYVCPRQDLNTGLKLRMSLYDVEVDSSSRDKLHIALRGDRTLRSRHLRWLESTWENRLVASCYNSESKGPGLNFSLEKGRIKKEEMKALLELLGADEDVVKTLKKEYRFEAFSERLFSGNRESQDEEEEIVEAPPAFREFEWLESRDFKLVFFCAPGHKSIRAFGRY